MKILKWVPALSLAATVLFLFLLIAAAPVPPHMIGTFVGDGASVTNLNASNLASGTVGTPISIASNQFTGVFVGGMGIHQLKLPINPTYVGGTNNCFWYVNVDPNLPDLVFDLYIGGVFTGTRLMQTPEGPLVVINIADTVAGSQPGSNVLSGITYLTNMANFINGTFRGNGGSISNDFRPQSVYVNSNATLSATLAGQMASTNIVVLADTTLSNLTVTFPSPPTAQTTFTIVNYGTNSLTITNASGVTFRVPNGYSFAYSNALTMLGYYDHSQQWLSLNSSNWFLVRRSRSLQELQDIAEAAVGGTNGIFLSLTTIGPAPGSYWNIGVANGHSNTWSTIDGSNSLSLYLGNVLDWYGTNNNGTPSNDFFGPVTSTAFYGDGSHLSGISAGGIATNAGTGLNNVLSNLTAAASATTTTSLNISNIAAATAPLLSAFSFTNFAWFFWDAGLGQHLRSTNAGWFTFFNTTTNPVYQLTNAGVPTLTSSNLAEWRTNPSDLNFTNTVAAAQYASIQRGTNFINSGNVNVGQTLQIAGQTQGSNTLVIASGGADITGYQTNETGLLWPTNVSGIGAYTAGLHYGTNFSADITLASFASVPVNKDWDIWVYYTNSAAAAHRITFPAGCTGTFNLTNLASHLDVGAGKDGDINFHGCGTMKTNAIIFPRSL